MNADARWAWLIVVLAAVIIFSNRLMLMLLVALQLTAMIVGAVFAFSRIRALTATVEEQPAKLELARRPETDARAQTERVRPAAHPTDSSLYRARYRPERESTTWPGEPSYS